MRAFREDLVINKQDLVKDKLLTHVGCFGQNVLILSEVFFVYGKEQESRKICPNRAKKFNFLRVFDRKNTLFEISRNLFRKSCLQLTVNARKS